MSASILGYIPNTLGVTVDEIKAIIVEAVSSDNIDADYVRGIDQQIKLIGGRQSKWPIDLLSTH